MSGWNVIRASAFEHPNVVEGRTVIPGGPSRAWIEDIRTEYGEDSPQYVARVLAKFPTESTEQLVPTAAIEAAFERFGKLDPPGGSPFILGIDPAGPGEDAFAVTVWRGRQAVEYHTWRRLEAPESADKIFDLMRDLRRGVVAKFTGATIGGLYVDEIGIGHGLVGILRRRCTGLEWGDVHVYGVNVAKKPTKKKRFVRRKDELIWRLREELVEGRVAFAPNAELAEEIRELRMRQTPDGRIETEPKDQMRARLGRSPDTLDSLLLGMTPWVGSRKVLIA